MNKEFQFNEMYKSPHPQNKTLMVNAEVVAVEPLPMVALSELHWSKKKWLRHLVQLSN